MNLVKKLAITLAISSTITLASCGYNNSLDNLTATVGSTSSTGITSVAFVLPETSKENHYISIIGHFDSGKEMRSKWKSTELVSYKDHKDFRITYQISKEDYVKISLVCGKSIHISNLSSDQLDVVNNVLSKYEAVDVVDLEVEEDYLHDELGENFRFNENEFNNKLNEKEN